MSKDRIWFLVGKKLAGEASAEELNELEGLLRSDPDMHYALQNITDLWNLSAPAAPEAEDAFNRHINRLKDAGADWDQAEEMQTPPDFTDTPKRSHKTLLVVSIAAAVLMIASIYWYNSVTKRPVSSRPLATRQAGEKNEVSTRNGSKTKITLPDGSKVWLNAGSKITYDKDFGGNMREVELSGEAFFEVVSLPLPGLPPTLSGGVGGKIPFIIHTQHIDVRVLGTAFNVKSYPGDKETETSLVHGKVEVLIHNRPDQKITLQPNDKLVVMNDEENARVTVKKGASHDEPIFSVKRLTYTTADSQAVETAWVQNKLVFDNESFEEIATKMERWYNVEIIFSDAKIKKEHFSGKFENETIQEALDGMRETGTTFHYSMQGNKIIIGR